MTDLITDQIPESDEQMETTEPIVENINEELTVEPEDLVLPRDPEDLVGEPEELTAEFLADGQKITAVEPEKELTEVEKLIQRRTGYWQVNLQEADVKWIKNACQGKFEYVGPNEAFMLMNCFIGFSSALSRIEQQAKENQQPTCVIQAAGIEACAFFMQRHKGSGLESAQRSFRIAMALNPVVMEMRELDSKIEGIRQQEKTATDSQKLEEAGVIEPPTEK
jgi:hypothetical protein